MMVTAGTIQATQTAGEGALSGRLGELKRFTLDGSEELEAHLEGTCQQVLAGIRRLVPESKLQGLLLGGGYGRGEGGVLRTQTGDSPYNDLEFYVFLRGNNYLNERRYDNLLHHLGRQLSPTAGVEVEFKALPFAKLRRSPASMFYYDLVMGHRRFWGDESLLSGCERHRNAERIPLSEAIRLLMNRCSGLLFARERLERAHFSPEDADFVGRNLAKAQLAFGDAVLTAVGQYHWSCRERHRRLQNLGAPNGPPSLDEVRRNHFSGVQFKLHPQRTIAPRPALWDKQRELAALGRQTWMWLECRRLDCPFVSARDYACSPVDKCPETGDWRNWALNLRTFGPSALLNPRQTRHPRERVFHALVWLLWEREMTDGPELFRRVGTELRVSVRSFAEAVDAYASLWRRFS